MTFTKQIDDYVMASAQERRAQMWLVFTIFALLGTMLVAVLVTSLRAGTLEGASNAFGAAVFFGLLTPFLTVIICAVFKYRPGILTWLGLILGGALIAGAPLLVLSFGGDFDSEVRLIGRWGTSAPDALGSTVWVLWGVATTMLVPGLLGTWRCLRSKTRP